MQNDILETESDEVRMRECVAKGKKTRMSHSIDYKTESCKHCAELC